MRVLVVLYGFLVTIGILQIQAMAAGTPAMAIVICSVTERLDAVDKRDPDGILELRLINDSTKPISIPFWCPIGKPVTMTQGKLFRRSFQFKGNEPSCGAALSNVTYSWMDSQGREFLSGNYQLVNPDLELAPMKSGKIVVPIYLPKHPGSYLLRVTFDNQNLVRAEQSFGSANAVSSHPEAWVHVRIQTDAKIDAGLSP